jgi:hypothetical protein
MGIWNLPTPRQARRLVSGEVFSGDVQVVTTVGQCVAAIMDLPNEELINVVTDLLQCMDDAEIYRKWAKGISDDYRRGYEPD